ncbi:MAG: tRNA (adenosine(37)-N6)-threonylcarbamoyltransferase complex ATPase subunit type 1 TsaE [Syntrophales bacterium]|jgi:tRNA threonylcarbamoyladenosine biosynthesis protein TsaE
MHTQLLFLKSEEMREDAELGEKGRSSDRAGKGMGSSSKKTIIECRNGMNEQTGKLTITSSSPEETFFIGKIIGRNLIEKDVVALIGDLGTGKTRLTQGIARGLGVPDEYQITSPSFTLINEYQGRMMLYHFDLYRLSRASEMDDMGYEEYLFGDGVSVIEWAEKVKNILPDETLSVWISYTGENERNIIISGQEKKIAMISEALGNGGF